MKPLARTGFPLFKGRWFVNGYGVAGVALLAAAAYWATVVNDRVRHVQALEHDVQVLDAQLQALCEAGRETPPSPDQRFAQLLSGLPSRQDVPDFLDAFDTLAKKSGVVLTRGQYGFSSREGDSVERFSMLLPVTGDFKSVMVFVRKAMATSPGLSLKGIDVTRRAEKKGPVDVKLNFVLFVKKTA